MTSWGTVALQRRRVDPQSLRQSRIATVGCLSRAIWTLSSDGVLPAMQSTAEKELHAYVVRKKSEDVGI